MRYLWIIPFACLIVALARAAEPEKPLVLGPEPATIKPAATLEELKKLDPIQVGDASIRLAIETDKVPLGSGLLVYCLWDGKDAPQREPIRNRHQKRLGPCTTQITRIYEKGEVKVVEDALIEKMSAVDTRIFKGDALFVASLVPPAKGKYEISVLSPAGDLIARARITCADEDKTTSHWHALAPIDAAESPRAFRPENPMVPNWEDVVLTDPRKTLPTFIPPEDPADLKAAADHGQITLTSSNDMDTDIADRILLRVFINGKPAMADVRVQKSDSAFASAAKMSLAKELQFTLSTDPQDYGASPRDSVEVQFLYCPGGAEPEPRQEVQQMLTMAKAFTDSRGVLISNRVQLIPAAKPAASQPAAAPARP